MIRVWLADFEGFCSIEGGVNAPNAPPCQPTYKLGMIWTMNVCVSPSLPSLSSSECCDVATRWTVCSTWSSSTTTTPARECGQSESSISSYYNSQVTPSLCVCVMSQGAGGSGARVLTHVPIVFLYDKCTHQHMHVHEHIKWFLTLCIYNYCVRVTWCLWMYRAAWALRIENGSTTGS